PASRSGIARYLVGGSTENRGRRAGSVSRRDRSDQMNENVGQCETPLADHVSKFWKYLDTETVRIVVDLKRTVGADAPDGPVVYWDTSIFSDDVAKAMI